MKSEVGPVGECPACRHPESKHQGYRFVQGGGVTPCAVRCRVEYTTFGSFEYPQVVCCNCTYYRGKEYED